MPQDGFCKVRAARRGDRLRRRSRPTYNDVPQRRRAPFPPEASPSGRLSARPAPMSCSSRSVRMDGRLRNSAWDGRLVVGVGAWQRAQPCSRQGLAFKPRSRGVFDCSMSTATAAELRDQSDSMRLALKARLVREHGLRRVPCPHPDHQRLPSPCRLRNQTIHPIRICCCMTWRRPGGQPPRGDASARNWRTRRCGTSVILGRERRRAISTTAGARTLAEAILLDGGEGQAASDKFKPSPRRCPSGGQVRSRCFRI